MAPKWFQNLKWTELQLVVCVAIFLPLTSARSQAGKIAHIVGGKPNTWSVRADPDFYQNWAFNERFIVGDKLVFLMEYNMTTPYLYEHSVIQFNDNKAFLRCDPNGGMDLTEGLEADTPTSVIVDLHSPGIFYYGCSKHDYCTHGQKFFIKVGSGE